LQKREFKVLKILRRLGSVTDPAGGDCIFLPDPLVSWERLYPLPVCPSPAPLLLPPKAPPLVEVTTLNTGSGVARSASGGPKNWGLRPQVPSDTEERKYKGRRTP